MQLRKRKRLREKTKEKASETKKKLTKCIYNTRACQACVQKKQEDAMPKRKRRQNQRFVAAACNEVKTSK